MRTLSEWDHIEAGPSGEGQELRGLWLDTPAIRAARLRLRGRLRIAENRHGLVIKSLQHVGAVQLGPLRVVVRPKIAVSDLWKILIYALDLTEVLEEPSVETALSEADFADLLALLLIAEVARLRSRGLRRRYVSSAEWLASPRGRLDCATLARALPLRTATLPCIHHDLSVDILANQVIRAGLGLAQRAAQSPAVRAAAARAEAEWSRDCSSPTLTKRLLDRADQARDRLLTAYAPAHRLVRLIFNGLGTHHAPPSGQDAVRGFFWDMATLFESFVRRFLAEHLTDVDVRKRRLRGLYHFVKNPRKQRTPCPVPDLVIRRGREVLAVADTKYMDLSDQRFGRDILYQVSVYAAAHYSGRPPPTVILYPQPVDRPPAPDSALDMHVGRAGPPCRITLRAVDWNRACRLLSDSYSHAERVQLARSWLAE